MTVRAKLKLDEIKSYSWSQTMKGLVFNAVCDNSTDENVKFTKYTPSGTFTMNVDNPGAMAQFELGKYYYVDFNEAPKE